MNWHLRSDIRRHENAAADALDQDRIDGSAPPAHREGLAARMTENQKVDRELAYELGDDFDRLADDQVVDDVESLACENGMRGLQIGFHVLALVRERDFGDVLAGEQIR